MKRTSLSFSLFVGRPIVKLRFPAKQYVRRSPSRLGSRLPRKKKKMLDESLSGRWNA